MIIRSVEDNDIKNENVARGKVVRSIAVASKLLSRIDLTPTNTLRVIDCKKDKTDPTGRSSVLVFEDNDKFQEVFAEVIEERKKERASSETEELRKQLEEMKQKIAELSATKE